MATWHNGAGEKLVMCVILAILCEILVNILCDLFVKILFSNHIVCKILATPLVWKVSTCVSCWRASPRELQNT